MQSSKYIPYRRAAVSLFLLAMLIGCGAEDAADWQPGDKDQIRELVAQISDARTNPEKLSTIFSEDAVPDKAWKRDAAQIFFVVGEVDIEGAAANVNIEFENTFGEIIGKQEWTCTKVDDAWKISAAPLK